jgi:uncharacterized protein YjbI with pentapeptide repeats
VANLKADTMANTSTLDIAGAQYPGARFVDTDLAGASFSDVSLRAARFDNVALTGATFSNVCLSGVSIADANLDGARIDGILITDLLRVYDAAQRSATP